MEYNFKKIHDKTTKPKIIVKGRCVYFNRPVEKILRDNKNFPSNNNKIEFYYDEGNRLILIKNSDEGFKINKQYAGDWVMKIKPGTYILIDSSDEGLIFQIK